MATEILFPVGRMIGGSMYKSNPKTDRKTKQPVIGKDGQPVISYSFGVSIAKGHEQHWSQTAWGAIIKQIGDLANPGISSRPDYAWKVIDGDSTIPNTKNKKPCDQIGYARHWVLWFSQGWPPKLVNATGTVDLIEPDSVMPGYFIEVFGSVAPNNSADSPGVYLNPVCVALAGYGERIESAGIDATTVGFGGKAPVAGMSAVPVASMSQPHTPINQMHPAPTQIQVHTIGQPNPSFLAPPPVQQMPQRIMSPAAGGTYEQFVASGWNDAQLIAAGHMRMA